MPVRYTAAEIKSNLKFLFSAAFIVATITLILQMVLMKYEKRSEEIYTELNRTESEVSQYRNLIWLMHNNTKSYSSSFTSEYLEFSKTFASTKVDLIKENFPIIRGAVEGIGLEKYLTAHDHNTCVQFMSDARGFIENFRSTKQVESIELQKRVDVINMVILGLLTVLAFLFFYTAAYSLYGK